MKYDKLKYNILGNNGDVVFFLHGYGGSASSLAKLGEWISKNKQCYMFDLYGFGQTAFPNKCYDIYDYAIGLYLFCVEKGIREVSIVAHSFGGRIAMILSSVFDIKVKKLVLIDSAGLKPKRTINYYIKVFRYKLHKKHNKFACGSEKYGSEEYRKLTGLQRCSYVKVVNQHLEYLLPRIICETLILWGNDDKDTPFRMCKKLQNNIKLSRSIIYSGDHFMYVKKYKTVRRDIGEFLNSGEYICS